MKTATTGADEMNAQFIYVFDASVRDAMLKAGFMMLKNDEDSSLFIFRADESVDFDFSDITYYASNTLTF